jgi:hypothetical protein
VRREVWFFLQASLRETFSLALSCSNVLPGLPPAVDSCHQCWWLAVLLAAQISVLEYFVLLIFSLDWPSFTWHVLRSSRKKGKTVPLQARSGPERSRKLKFPDFMTMAQDGGKVVSLAHRPPLPQEIHLVLISVRGWLDPRAIVRPEGLCQNFQWHRPESNPRPAGL